MSEIIKFDVKTVSQYIGCSESSTRKMVRLNLIPYYKVFSRILFDKIAIDEWLSNGGVNQCSYKN